MEASDVRVEERIVKVDHLLGLVVRNVLGVRSFLSDKKS